MALEPNPSPAKYPQEPKGTGGGRSWRSIRNEPLRTTGWETVSAASAMTVREQETLLHALELWRKAVGEMSWEARAEAALALRIVRDDELEELRRRIQQGKIL